MPVQKHSNRHVTIQGVDKRATSDQSWTRHKVTS